MVARLGQLGIVSRFGEFPRLGSGCGRKGTKSHLRDIFTLCTSLSFAQFQRDQKPRLIQANEQSVRNERNFGDFIYIRNTLYYSRYSHYSSLNLFV
jgi:hypothetical protein